MNLNLPGQAKPAESTAPAADSKPAVDPNKVGDKVFDSTSEKVVGASPSLTPDIELEHADAQHTPIARILAEVSAADSGALGEGDRGGTLYSSHPIANLTFGRFQFEKSLLRLDGDDSAEFEKLLKTMPAVERNRIQKIDEQAAAAIVKQRIESSTTQQFDSSVGVDTLAQLRAVGPTKGTGRLEDGLEQPLGAVSRVEGFAMGKHDQNESVPGEAIQALQREQGEGGDKA